MNDRAVCQWPIFQMLFHQDSVLWRSICQSHQQPFLAYNNRSDYSIRTQRVIDLNNAFITVHIFCHKMLAVKGMWDPYVRIQVRKPSSYEFDFYDFVLQCKRCHVFRFLKKVRNDNSIFLITQLHTKTYLGLCETSMLELFWKRVNG